MNYYPRKSSYENPLLLVDGRGDRMVVSFDRTSTDRQLRTKKSHILEGFRCTRAGKVSVPKAQQIIYMRSVTACGHEQPWFRCHFPDDVQRYRERIAESQGGIPYPCDSCGTGIKPETKVIGVEQRTDFHEARFSKATRDWSQAHLTTHVSF